MSVVHTRRWTRAFTTIAVLVVGLTTSILPSARPAEAVGPASDLQILGGTEITESFRLPVHRFLMNYAQQPGTGPLVAVPAGKAPVVVTFPPGVSPKPGRPIMAIGPVPWDCTVNTSVVVCKNRFEIQPNMGATYFTVELDVPAPVTVKIVSSVDPFNIYPEANENNNFVTTTYRFVQ